MSVFGLPDLTLPVTADTTSLKRAITKVNTGLATSAALSKTLEMNLYNAGMAARRVGWASLAAFTAPIALIGRTAVKSFADFDQAMTQSLAIAGNVTQSLRREAEETAKALSTQITTPAKELGAAYFYLISAGFTLEQSIAALNPVAKFAQAGMFNMAQATEILTDAQSALGLTVQDSTQNMMNLTRVGDVLVKANQMANASVEQFSRSLTNQAASASRLFGIQLEDTVAVLATMADQGLKGQVAGMRFSMMIRGMTSAAIRNADAFKRLGVQVFDSTGKFRPMYEIIQNLEQALGNLSHEKKMQSLMQLGFTERSLGGIMPLLGQSNRMWSYFNRLVYEAGGAIEEVVQNQLKSFSAQLQMIKNQITVAAIEIGKRLAPYVLKVAEYFRNFAKWVAALSDETIKWITYVSVGFALFGPALLVLGGILMSMATLVKATKVFAIVLIKPIKLLSSIPILLMKITAVAFSRVFRPLVSGIALITKEIYHVFTYFTGKFLMLTNILIFRMAAIFSVIKVKIFFTAIMTGLKGMLSFLTFQLLPAILGMVFAFTAVASIIKSFGVLFSRVGEVSIEDWWKKAQGFFHNFQHNMKVIFDYLNNNWEIILSNLLIGMTEIVKIFGKLLVQTIVLVGKMMPGLWQKIKDDRLARAHYQIRKFEYSLKTEEEQRADPLKPKDFYIQEYYKHVASKQADHLTKGIESFLSELPAFHEMFNKDRFKKMPPIEGLKLDLPETKSEADHLTDALAASQSIPNPDDLFEGLGSTVGSAIKNGFATFAEVGTTDFYKSIYGVVDTETGIQKNIEGFSGRIANATEGILDFMSGEEGAGPVSIAGSIKENSAPVSVAGSTEKNWTKEFEQWKEDPVAYEKALGELRREANDEQIKALQQQIEYAKEWALYLKDPESYQQTQIDKQTEKAKQELEAWNKFTEAWHKVNLETGYKEVQGLQRILENATQGYNKERNIEKPSKPPLAEYRPLPFLLPNQIEEPIENTKKSFWEIDNSVQGWIRSFNKIFDEVLPTLIMNLLPNTRTIDDTSRYGTWANELVRFTPKDKKTDWEATSPHIEKEKEKEKAGHEKETAKNTGQMVELTRDGFIRLNDTMETISRNLVPQEI